MGVHRCRGVQISAPPFNPPDLPSTRRGECTVERGDRGVTGLFTRHTADVTVTCQPVDDVCAGDRSRVQPCRID
ncbi:hypothetical protein AFA91_08760 [Mycolicibacterium goodii]|uniref:Uncharacterized protein n=1 Tax=Mycolicibacterium goodii TaxID=134601 RepID=A0A0K0X3E0_MYCGD|nr:hypothetical protein AFA91_08760 [Mycolicibacterium goodii]